MYPGQHYQYKDSRDYVDALQSVLEDEGYINKGETDDSDMSGLSETTIHQELAKRMSDSTVTIVLISPNMKEQWKSETQQWIPWEVSYSLRTKTFKTGRRKKPSAMIAVVLPNMFNSYNYYIKGSTCRHCDTLTYDTDTLFPILDNNMFNSKHPERTKCSHCNTFTYTGESCYIDSVTWDDFIEDVDTYIEEALERQRNRADYDIHTTLQEA